MTSAEFASKPTQNPLYATLRTRFCADGDKTIGERMLQASTQMKPINTDVFAAVEENAPSAVYQAVAPKKHERAFRDFFAVLLCIGIFVCLAVSLFRLAIDKTAASEAEKNLPFSVSTVSEEDISKQTVIFMTADENIPVTKTEASDLYKSTYLSFADAFGE